MTQKVAPKHAMPMTSDLTNFTNNISVRSNKTAQEKNLKVGHKGVSPSTKLSTSTRGISPNFNAKPMTTPVELSIKNKNDQI